MLSVLAPVTAISGIGPKRAGLLGQLGIETARDLLQHFPVRYEDRRSIAPVASVSEGERVTVEVEAVRSRSIRLRRKMSLAEVTFRDDTGEIKATWFGRGFLARSFPAGTRAVLTGTAGQYKGLCLKNPDYEILDEDEGDRTNTGCIVPIYPLTEKLTQALLRRWIREVLEEFGEEFPDALPEGLRLRYGYGCAKDAIRRIHFPEELEETAALRERFAYEELLAMQISLLRPRRRVQKARAPECPGGGERLRALRTDLPFELTRAQREAVSEILLDMARSTPMQRLLQGDVGSGKTVVALHAIAAAVDSGYQAAFMAPTELLAEQHYLNLAPYMEAWNTPMTLLTGATRKAQRVRKAIAEGRTQVVVGTHALFQESTAFRRLGLAIVDEQHRFGVAQRAKLAGKGAAPHVLHLTATPIPRSLSMTLYGAMDLSLMNELPKGRKPVKTRRVLEEKTEDLYRFVGEQAEKGFQAYYICPRIDDDETTDLAAVTAHFEALSSGPFEGLRTGLLHGRLDFEEKEAVMGAFKEGALDVLFSTTVVEVGVDAPKATIMIIEDAAQFGLTQLHQLRGRVGRSSEQSYCFLLGTPKTEEGEERLEVVCSTTDGFEIADRDLAMRGPGQLTGLKQAGLSDLKAADLVRDVEFIGRARRDAREILRDDPKLSMEEHRFLGEMGKRFGRVRA